jgi:hypothetical protein
MAARLRDRREGERGGGGRAPPRPAPSRRSQQQPRPLVRVEPLRRRQRRGVEPPQGGPHGGAGPGNRHAPRRAPSGPYAKRGGGGGGGVTRSAAPPPTGKREMARHQGGQVPTGQGRVVFVAGAGPRPRSGGHRGATGPGPACASQASRRRPTHKRVACTGRGAAGRDPQLRLLRFPPPTSHTGGMGARVLFVGKITPNRRALPHTHPRVRGHARARTAHIPTKHLPAPDTHQPASHQRARGAARRSRGPRLAPLWWRAGRGVALSRRPGQRPRRGRQRPPAAPPTPPAPPARTSCWTAPAW